MVSEARIFVNRNLRMASVRAIGFDLDHTLAHYRGPAVEELAYNLTRERLVDQCGYPSELLNVPYDRTFVIRGLVIDKRRGNILKMDYHNYVARGYHGLRLLDHDERKSIYRTGRVRMKSAGYVTVDTLFHLPEVYLYLVLVDLLERRGRREGLRSYGRIYQDVRQSIDSVHGDGTLKTEILGNLGRYIRRDPRILTTLREFRAQGKKVFLLTNSELYYTEKLLEYLFAGASGKPVKDWREVFDLIVADAGKPTFFTADVKGRPAAAEPGTASPPVYHGGTAKFLEQELGFSGDQILYFGDHTYGDILRSKKTLGWRTAMVVEELREEMEASRKVQAQLDELNHWKALRDVLETDVSTLEIEIRKMARRRERATGKPDVAARFERKGQVLAEQRQSLLDQLIEVRRNTVTIGDEVNRAYNPHWGPLFREGPEMSRFAHQVKDFACIYMAQVSNFLNYNLDHYFRSPSELMPHEIS